MAASPSKLRRHARPVLSEKPTQAWQKISEQCERAFLPLADNTIACREHADSLKKRSRLRRVRCAHRTLDKTRKVGSATSKNQQDLGMQGDVSVE